ncbi:MAG TPA: adenylate/guanylate cyclase domain-containing protein [Myxococcota bacterium]|nr:adenylate/guanylate cyclase domain-containing protein [Myxococcota bacterium]
MPCPRCGHPGVPGARFCGACGERLPVPGCAACGAANPPEHRFCHACGAALAAAGPPPVASGDPRSYTPRHLAERILTSRAALEGERKHVTVVFADVAGFTALCEPLDPEQVHALMDRFFQAVLEQVHRHDGTVNQFTGDGVMALFGAPIALEDAPQRAIRAALAIQRAIEPIDRDVQARFGRPFRMRVGIHSGPVVVGRIGDDLRMDYTAVGDTTNLAARLQQDAPPGAIRISEATERLAAGFFELREVGDLEVRGRSARVRVFEVEGERAVRDRIEARAGEGLTPFVGRRRELEALAAALDAARCGHGQVVFLVGDAGAGKSRLLYELRARLAEEPHSWFEGRCSSYGRNTAFGPLIDGLRREFGIDDRDDESTALARIARAEAEAGDTLAWTLPYLRQLLSLSPGDEALAALDPATRRSETLRALLARLLRAAGQQLLTIVIEDLHWIDAASEEVLGFLADSVPAARVLLVFTHRPGYRQPFGDRSYHHRIALQPLTEPDMTVMTGALLGLREVPPELRRLIARKAEGNPFFVEEVAVSLRERDALGDTSVSIPDRIQDVLMARLDRLDEGPKRALQIASVIGREFALRLLEQIAAAGDRLHPVVAELRALELIYEKAAHPELAFMFKHALTHEVAYESMLVERRRSIHRLVARAIEGLYRDRLPEHYEALANHFALGEEWERALDYHELAAEKAARGYANHDAAEHCRRALAIAERLGEAVAPERRRRLGEWLGRATWLVSEFRPSGEAYEGAASLCEEPGARAGNLVRAARSFQWGHDYPAAGRCTEQALALAGAHGLAGAGEWARFELLFQQVSLDGLEHVDGRAAEALVRGHAGDEESTAWGVLYLGELAEWSSEFERALGLLEQALALGRRLQMPDLVVAASWFVAKSCCGLGRYGRALALLRESLELCDRIGDRAFRARLENTLGWCLAEIGAHAAAREHNQRAAVLARRMVELDLVPGAPEVYGNAAINLACNQLVLGDGEAAAATLAPIREELARGCEDDPWMRWRYALHLADADARLALAGGDPEAALAHCDAELAGARRHRVRKFEARALELRGRALLAMDARDAAEEALAAALAGARAIGHPPIAWRALALLGECARRRGETARGAERAAEVTALVGGLAGELSDPELRRGLLAAAERAVADPLGTLR